MLQRSQIEKLLKINGIDVAAPDEEIKSVLISARWHKNDVDTALMVLHENTKSHNTHVDTLHKVFTSDDVLDSETISSLLGIDVDISDEDIALRRTRAHGGLTTGLLLNMVIVSLVLSTIFVISAMWYLEMGLFYQGGYY